MRSFARRAVLLVVSLTVVVSAGASPALAAPTGPFQQATLHDATASNSHVRFVIETRNDRMKAVRAKAGGQVAKAVPKDGGLRWVVSDRTQDGRRLLRELKEQLDASGEAKATGIASYPCGAWNVAKFKIPGYDQAANATIQDGGRACQ